MKTTEDRVLNGQVILHQPVSGYRAAVDPIFLAAALAAHGGERALDLGCGVGAALLCLAARIDGLDIDGVELQPDLAALARQNVTANGWQNRLRVFDGDILAPPLALQPDSYHHVFANPPYLSDDRGHPPSHAGKRTAYVEGAADLAAWVQAALRFCRPKGSLTFIYRADRLAEVLKGLDGKAGEVIIFPLWPKDGASASRIIVRARKAIKTPMQLRYGLTLHTADGAYTEAADRILRGAALTLE